MELASSDEGAHATGHTLTPPTLMELSFLNRFTTFVGNTKTFVLTECPRKLFEFRNFIFQAMQNIFVVLFFYFFFEF